MKQNTIHWNTKCNKITYPIELFDESIKIEAKNNLLNTKTTIFVCMNNKKEIPLYQYKNYVTNYELEKKLAQ